MSADFVLILGDRPLGNSPASEGLTVARSSGAYMAGLERVARRECRGRFVTVFNDLGERYFSSRLWN